MPVDNVTEPIFTHTDAVAPEDTPPTEMETVVAPEVDTYDPLEDNEITGMLQYSDNSAVVDFIYERTHDKETALYVKDELLRTHVINGTVPTYTELLPYITTEIKEELTRDIIADLKDGMRNYEDSGTSMTFVIGDTTAHLGNIGDEYTLSFPTSLEAHTQYSALFDYAIRNNVLVGEVPVAGGAVILPTEVAVLIPDTILTHRYRARYKYERYLETINVTTDARELIKIVWEDVRTVTEVVNDV